MRTSILLPLAFLLTFVLSFGTSDSRETASKKTPDRKPPSTTAEHWTIKGRVFSKSRSINAVDLGLTAASTVDQSSTLAKTIQHASETSGIDTVYVPEGTYYIAKAIALKPGANLIGDGPGRTVFDRKDASNYLMQAKQLDFGDAVVANLALRNSHRTLLMRDVRNLRFHNVEFRSVEKGSINLSGHKNCYVASNDITSAKLMHSGYAGIRLPNGAKNNIVENNFIENHGRGLFILSSSEDNIVRSNTVKNTTYQGVLIQ